MDENREDRGVNEKIDKKDRVKNGVLFQTQHDFELP